MFDPLGSALTTRKVILILNIENAVLLSFSGIIIWRKIGKERRRRLCHLASFSLTVLPLFFLVCWLSCRVCLICWRLSSYLLQTGLSSSLLSHAKRKENSWWTQSNFSASLIYLTFLFVFAFFSSQDLLLKIPPPHKTVLRQNPYIKAILTKHCKNWDCCPVSISYSDTIDNLWTVLNS